MKQTKHSLFLKLKKYSISFFFTSLLFLFFCQPTLAQYGTAPTVSCTLDHMFANWAGTAAMDSIGRNWVSFGGNFPDSGQGTSSGRAGIWWGRNGSIITGRWLGFQVFEEASTFDAYTDIPAGTYDVVCSICGTNNWYGYPAATTCCIGDTRYKPGGVSYPKCSGSGGIKTIVVAAAATVTPTKTKTPTPRPLTPTKTKTPTPRPVSPTPTRTRTPTPTATPRVSVPTPTRTRTPTPTATPRVSAPTPTRTRTPTPTPTKLPCNGSCSASSQCGTGLSCISSRCRASACSSSTTCSCLTASPPTPTRTRTPTPTATPRVSAPTRTRTPTPRSGTPTPTRTPTRTPTPGGGGPTATRTPTPYHLACSGVSCQRVAGNAANSCAPQGGSCSQTEGGSGSSACGPYSYTATCTCSGPCCPGTCANGVACGSSQPISGCTDQTPQNRPTISSVRQPDGGAIVQTRYVTVTWTFTDSGNGCGRAWGYNCGGNDISFTLQIDNNSDFSSPIVNVANIESTSRSYTTTASDNPLTTNTTYYVRVCADNAGQNCSVNTSFTKQVYGNGTIGGSVGEYDPDGNPPYTDNGASGGGGTSIIVSPENNNGVIWSCTEIISGTPPEITGYSCTISFDNVNFDPDPTQLLTISTTNYNTSLYSGICLDNGTSCVPVTLLIDFDNNGGISGNDTVDIYYSIRDPASYYKLKNVDFYSRGQVTSLFPVSIEPFDSEDSDTNYLLIGDSAISVERLGTSLTSQDSNLGNAMPSRKGWENETYSHDITITYDRFDDYVKSRKNSVEITNLNQLKEAEINRWEGNLTINASDVSYFTNKNIVLVVTGTLTLNVDEFLPVGATTAFLASKVNFFGDSQLVSEAKGIFMADTIDFGTGNIPLKITGNLTSTRYQANPVTRKRDDNRKPSFFLVFSVDPYITLLDKLSTAVYEWKQL